MNKPRKNMERKDIKVKPTESFDRIIGDEILLDGRGVFPKKLIIIETGNRREYELKKTSSGKYLLN